MDKTYFRSPIGVLEIVADENAVFEINFVTEFVNVQVKNEILKLCLDELERYFKGELKEFKTPVNLHGTEFMQSVYKALMDVKYGTTATYKDIAKIINHEKAFRAVGSANAKNKIPIIVPCHRVVTVNSLGGYSGGEGLKTKKFLLEFERNFLQKDKQNG